MDTIAFRRGNWVSAKEGVLAWEHLWSEKARSWLREYNRHQVWGESLVRDSLQLGDCSRGLSVKVDFKIIKLKQMKKTNFIAS